MPNPPHHTKDGFRNPWPGAEPKGFGDVIRWSMQRRRQSLPPDPAPGTFPLAAPSFGARAQPDELAATWVGHSTVLLQIGALNVLTDPMWSERASPVSFAGPARFVPPAVDFDALPSIDLVLLSHNHYDHLDRPTVKRLAERFPDADWAVPLGLVEKVVGWGVRRAHELDWWGELRIRGVTIGCTPAQHFSARGFGDRGETLWCGWTVADDRFRVYFAGDTAFFPEFGAIAERFGPFDMVMLPIGAYEPRWFMRSVHMNPDEALQAYRELSERTEPAPAMVPIHWGTFRLTDEAMDEPPRRIEALWREAGFDAGALWLLRHGETRRRREAR